MRITGGRFRSRVLDAPAGKATRPTSDRVREGLFGILAAAGVIEGRRVLDLYAGTGALGLEALSRGAAQVTFVESRREALAVLRANVDALGVRGSSHVVASSVTTAAARLAPLGPFHLVFADPPWALVDTGEATRALAALVAAGLLAEGAWVVVEHSSRSADPDIEGLSHARSRRYGDTTLAFYKTGILGRPRGDEGARFPFE
jgi:16S rRNA (guanine966-N2)-methyltransferase